jgi:NAD(P)-dependent dehydrogenase (short-subunit alcohol dehydrogenase family)
VDGPRSPAGAVDTELWHRLPEAERLATCERLGARLPVGRVGKPEDIAEAYLYLMKTGFSTGETISSTAVRCRHSRPTATIAERRRCPRGRIARLVGGPRVFRPTPRKIV